MAKAELFQKDIPKEERVFYYTSEEDDPIKTDEQEKHEEVRLPEGYQFIPKNLLTRVYSAILYRVFKIFAQYYERGYWKVKFYGREKLKKARGKGYVLYANHTNPYHDAFSPALVADRRIFTIVSPVNLKIPGIGKYLPYIGALPLGATLEEKIAFNEAVDKRLKQKKCLVVSYFMTQQFLSWCSLYINEVIITQNLYMNVYRNSICDCQKMEKCKCPSMSE